MGSIILFFILMVFYIYDMTFVIQSYRIGKAQENELIQKLAVGMGVAVSSVFITAGLMTWFH